MYGKKYLYVWRKITVCMEKNNFKKLYITMHIMIDKIKLRINQS